MGLDQYAFARKGEPIETTEDYTYQDFDGNTHTERQRTRQAQRSAWQREL